MMTRTLLILLLALSCSAQSRRGLLMGTATSGGSSISVVNTTSGSDTSGSRFSTLAATAANHTTGNTLGVWVHINVSDNYTVTNVTDTAGNIYTAGNVVADGSNAVSQWWYCTNITGNASNVVTAHFSGASQYIQVLVFQIAGVTALDVNGTGVVVAGVTTVTSNSFSTSTAAEIILFGVGANNQAQTFTAGNIGSATPGAPYADANGMSAVEYVITTTTQSSITATMNESAYGHILANVISFH